MARVLDCLRVAREYSRSRNPLLGVLLFGSRAQEPALVRPDSDVDLICLVSDQLPSPVKLFAKPGNVLFDLSYTTVPLIKRALSYTHPNNTNFFLNAFIEGTILADSDDTLKSLISSAKEIHKAGPSPMDPEERQNLELQTAAALLRIDALLNEQTASQEAEGLLLQRCHTQFHIFFYGYCRAHRLWASSVPNTFHWSQQSCPELYHLSAAFFRATTLKAKIEALRVMRAAVFQ